MATAKKLTSRTRKKGASPARQTFDTTEGSLEEVVDHPQEGNKNKKFFFFAVPLVSLGLLAGIIYAFKGLLIAAMVDNQPISRLELDRQLEKQNGKTVLEGMILQKLILNEAKRNGVNASQQDIDVKMQEIDKQFADQGQKLDDFLALRGQTRKDIEDQVRIQLTVEKLLGNEVTVSEEEVNNYFKQNQSFYPKGANLENVKGEIENTLKQQKLAEKFQTWSQDLKTKAKVSYFLQL